MLKNQSGATTLFEMLTVLSIIGILAAFVLINVNAVENKRRARDLTRITDLSILMQAIEEYQIDNNNELPGTSDKTYRSDQKPDGSSCAPNCANLSDGWMENVFGEYMATLRADPVNAEVNGNLLIYRYKHDDIRYELDCRLESLRYQELMANDGGNDNDRYEMGTGIDVISF